MTPSEYFILYMIKFGAFLDQMDQELAKLAKEVICVAKKGTKKGGGKKC